MKLDECRALTDILMEGIKNGNIEMECKVSSLIAYAIYEMKNNDILTKGQTKDVLELIPKEN